MSEKQKLTLSVNKEVVEKAKEMGINISEITEDVLRGFAFTPTELDDEELYRQYQELFSFMLPTMKKYNFSVEVATNPYFDNKGEYLGSLTLSLLTNSIFWVDEIEHSFSDITKIPVHDFHTPIFILEKFLKGLTDSVDKRKEHLKELEMAKRIVQAISGTVMVEKIDPYDRSDG